MSSLSEIDRDLDQIAVDAARLAEVQRGIAARGKIALSDVDAELALLGNGSARVVSTMRVDAPQPAAPAQEDEDPPSGQIDVPDDVLESAELPAVLAIQPPAPEPLALDLDSDETPLGGEDDLSPVPTSASFYMPLEAPAVDAAPPTETRPLEGLDDPSTDLASLLGDSDPMRDEGAEPLAPAEIEPEPTMMFSAEDAERFSRPAPAMPEDEDMLGDVELEVDEIIEIDEEPASEPAAARPRTAPPPPPRTGPPPPPGRASEVPQSRGFLGKLLQRKP